MTDAGGAGDLRLRPHPSSDAAGHDPPAPVLSVSLYCMDDAFTCDAYASGGSGGYTFTWTSATEYDSEPGYSAAMPHCTDYIGGVYVRVKVTDGLGAMATVGDGVVCNPY